MNRKFLTLLALLAATLPAARAQLKVELDVNRHYYLRHEPLFAKVKITNLSGRDLLLEDAGSPWFGFTITQGGAENLISPRNPDYHLTPMEIKIGETLTREVNINSLFPLSELGPYKIRATIFVKESQKYFGSNSAKVEITEGHVLWQQSVGVPETMPNAGATHVFTLLTAPGIDHEYLYCRIEDPETGTVYGTQRIGHLIDGTQPQMEFDASNTLHILQLLEPKAYMLTQIGVNGDGISQTGYEAPKFKPMLKRDAAGGITVVGAMQVASTKNMPANAVPGPKLSDRPPGLK